MKVRIYITALLIFMMGALGSCIYVYEESARLNIIRRHQSFSTDVKGTDLTETVLSGYQELVQQKGKMLVYGILISLLFSVYIAVLKRKLFKQQKLVRQYQANVQQLNEINRVSGIGFWEWDIKTNRIFWSDQIYKIFNLVKHENHLTYDLFLRRVHPEDRDAVITKLEAALKNKEEYEIDHRILDSAGNIIYVHEKGDVKCDQSGTPVKLIGTVIDVTETKKSREQLTQNLQALNTIFESDLIGVLNLSTQGNILSVNHYVCALTGYDQDELINRNINSLATDKKEISGWLQNRYSEQESSFSLTLSDKNKQHIFIDMLLKPVFNSSGSLEHFLCLIIDVTEKVIENQRILEREKQHKKTLIREIHHRIKNHLQGVMGLIQNNLLEYPEAKEVLEKSMLQINSLAVTYGLQSKNDNGEIYLCDLVNASVDFNNNFLESYQSKIGLSIPTDRPFQLARGTAAPVSLIINELLLNAIKHSSCKSTHIDVDLAIDDKKNALIRVENANCQLPENFDLSLNNGIGTGLELIKALLPEHADLKIKNIGTNVVAEFHLAPPLITYQA